MSDPRSLDSARRELQRLGYLTHRVERFLLSDAVSAAGEPRAFALLSLKVGLLGGTLLALANALALGVANDLFASSPGDLLPLFAHLWLPLVLFCSLGFVAAASGFLFALRLFPRRRLEALILGIAFLVTGALFAWAVYRASDLLLELGRVARIAVAIGLPLLAAGVAKLLANGLLSFAIRLTQRAPRERLVARRTIVAAIAGALGLLLAVALAWPVARPPVQPVSLPVAPGVPVALVAVDGILASEIDYLLARGALPELSRRLAAGGMAARYRRSPEIEPAELWTTVATGVDSAHHGVGAVDGYRPVGVGATLSRGGPWIAWWRDVAAPLGLAEHRPLLAGRRRAFMFWELAARGGVPVAAVNWWSTFPAAPLSGLVVAHGAFQLLEGDAQGAVEPAARAPELAALARSTAPGSFAETLAAAVPESVARAELSRALLPDRFYREVAGREAGSRALALYLPAIDLMAEAWRGDDVAFADLVRLQLAEIDALLATLRATPTVVLVFDAGRRTSAAGPGEGVGSGAAADAIGSEGRIFVLRNGCGVLAAAEMEPREVASLLLRDLGLPQSEELPDPPAGCSWPQAPARVATYGEKDRSPDPPAGSGAYLENLRSLGYL